MSTNQPNLLFILADDIAVDALRIDQASGTAVVHVKDTEPRPLPNIERLLKNGVNFPNAWSQPVCSPTRASIFTGMHPWRTNVGHAAINADLYRHVNLPGNPVTGARVSTELRTLAHVLSDANYKGSIYGKWHLGYDENENVPTALGWHRHEGILGGGFLRDTDYAPDLPDPTHPDRERYKDLVGGNPDVHDGEKYYKYCTWLKDCRDTMTGANLSMMAPTERTHVYATADQLYSARDWIKQMNGCPWWVTLAFTTPHDPFHVPPAETFTIQFKDPNKPTLQEMFVAMTESLDYYIGQLLDDPSPEIQIQLKNTIIVFAGDNGTHDAVDKERGDDKKTANIGGAHVPMIIADGGAIAGGDPCYFDKDRLGTTQSNLVHLLDIYQTFTEITGGEPPSYQIDSISMVPYLKDTSGDNAYSNWEARAYNLTQYFGPEWKNPNVPRPNRGPFAEGDHAAITDGKYKLSYDLTYNPALAALNPDGYEFTELVPNSDYKNNLEDGLLVEKRIDDLSHPKAIELWQALTDPDGQYYAQRNGFGGTFPPLLPQYTLEFDGVDDYVEIPYTSELNPAHFTISCWVKPTGGSYYRSPLTSRHQFPQAGYILYAGANNRWQFWTGNGGSYTRRDARSYVVPGDWFHLAVTFDGVYLKGYVDGSREVSSYHQNHYRPNQNSPLRFGAGRTETNPTYFFKGQIDEVKIWNYARSESEIKAAMRRRMRGDEEGLVGYWCFDEGEGNIVKDKTGNGNDGTIHGAKWVTSDVPIS